MTTKTTKYSLCTIVALASLIGVIYSLSTTDVDASITRPDREVSTGTNAGPEKYIVAGQPILNSIPDNREIVASKGNVRTVVYNLGFEKGANSDASITVRPSLDSYIILPSALESTTMKERADAFAAGKPLQGTISMDDLVTFTPETLTIKAGESKPIQMQIRIPSDISEEVIGDTITFSPSFHVIESEGVDRLGGFVQGVDVTIGE